MTREELVTPFTTTSSSISLVLYHVNSHFSIPRHFNHLLSLFYDIKILLFLSLFSDIKFLHHPSQNAHPTLLHPPHLHRYNNNPTMQPTSQQPNQQPFFIL